MSGFNELFAAALAIIAAIIIYQIIFLERE